MSVTADPMAAKTAGQQGPTSASGTLVRLGASGYERGGDDDAVGNTLVCIHRQSGRPVGHRRQELRAVDTGGDRQHRAHGAGGVLVGKGAAIEVLAGNVNRMSTQVPETGTLKATSSPCVCSRRGG
ncbi:hypothetical protein J113_17615 [Mycobacterium tuberculosis CAS/NITR204]|uniref:Uncharacterized protein n=1 Tax=Mycobacterium tuberculosis CAS/NITR204 TaxID=1310114 RepID=R4MGF3_MYCTX|nr:hypothetical protein J113_17615 [Mycobacterium tuberculosis CAS/NITR204]